MSVDSKHASIFTKIGFNHVSSKKNDGDNEPHHTHTYSSIGHIGNLVGKVHRTLIPLGYKRGNSFKDVGTEYQHDDHIVYVKKDIKGKKVTVTHHDYVNEENEINEISDSKKRSYLDAAIADTGKRWREPLSPEHKTPTGKPKKSWVNSPERAKLSNTLVKRREYIQKAAVAVTGKKHFSDFDGQQDYNAKIHDFKYKTESNQMNTNKTSKEINELSSGLLKRYSKKVEKPMMKHWEKGAKEEDKAMSTDGNKYPEKQARHNAAAGEAIRRWKNNAKGLALAQQKLKKNPMARVHASVNEAHTEGQLKSAIRKHDDAALEHSHNSLHHLRTSLKHQTSGDWKSENEHTTLSDRHERASRGHERAAEIARNLLHRMNQRKLRDNPPAPVASPPPKNITLESATEELVNEWGRRSLNGKPFSRKRSLVRSGGAKHLLKNSAEIQDDGVEKIDEISAVKLNIYKRKAKKSWHELDAAGYVGKAAIRDTGINDADKRLKGWNPKVAKKQKEPMFETSDEDARKEAIRNSVKSMAASVLGASRKTKDGKILVNVKKQRDADMKEEEDGTDAYIYQAADKPAKDAETVRGAKKEAAARKRFLKTTNAPDPQS